MHLRNRFLYWPGSIPLTRMVAGDSSFRTGAVVASVDEVVLGKLADNCAKLAVELLKSRRVPHYRKQRKVFRARCLVCGLNSTSRTLAEAAGKLTN